MEKTTWLLVFVLSSFENTLLIVCVHEILRRTLFKSKFEGRTWIQL